MSESSISNNLHQNPNQNNTQSQSNQINQSNNQKVDYNNKSDQNQPQQNKDNQKKDEEKEKQKQKENNLNNNYELSIEYENSLRQEIELSTPLVSEELSIKVLLDDYKSNAEYSTSIKQITDKYKYIRKVRRDGNCFYRSFIYRIFEYICLKNNKNLYEHIVKKIKDAKDLIIRNGYDWAFIEEFYNNFYVQFHQCFNSLQTKGVSARDYLDALFTDKEMGNYLIYFIRFCISAFLKENSFLYEVYVDGPFGNWVTAEVEAIDHEADQIQIMACVNYFDIGVKIEYLNPHKNEVMKFPEDKPDDQIFITVLFTPGHYDLLYS